MASHSTPNTTTRPSNARHPTAPSIMSANGHFAGKEANSEDAYEHGVQVIDGDKHFKYNSLESHPEHVTDLAYSHKLSTYLNLEKITPAGFNYHLISVFGLSLIHI